jgi:hypothetical protein
VPWFCKLKRHPSLHRNNGWDSFGVGMNLNCWILIHSLIFLSSTISSSLFLSHTDGLEKQHLLAMQQEMMKWRNSEQSFRQKYSENLSLNCPHDPVITFIFLGDGSQSSFSQTANSLFGLAHCAWKAIILYSVPSDESAPEFHGDPPFHLSNILPDSRIAYLPTMNFIQSLMSTVLPNILTTWISFLKVGDELTANYLSQLHHETQLFPDASSVIFQSSTSPPLTARTMRDRAVLPCYGYALKKSLFPSHSFGNRSSPPPLQTLSEFISPRILCSGTSVFSPVVTYLSSPTLAPAPHLSQRPPSQSVLLSFNNNTHCPLETEGHSPSSGSPQPSTAPDVSSSLSKREFFSRFYFPDVRNPFFEDNIRGLKESLFQLHQLGCIHPNLRVLLSPPPSSL